MPFAWYAQSRITDHLFANLQASFLLGLLISMCPLIAWGSWRPC